MTADVLEFHGREGLFARAIREWRRLGFIGHRMTLALQQHGIDVAKLEHALRNEREAE